MDKKLEALEKRESKLSAKEAEFEKEKEKVEELRESHLRELEKISGLTSEQAKDYLLRTVEEDVKHETAVLVKELERQAKDDADKKAKEYITRFGGTVTEVEDWGKKKLAYEIQKMSEGFYYFIQFEAETSAPAEIESRIRIMDGVIRYLCVKQNEK